MDDTGADWLGGSLVLSVVVTGVLVVAVVRTVLVSGQLVGHRGLVSLPLDWVYHDNLTLTGQISVRKSSSLKCLPSL